GGDGGVAGAAPAPQHDPRQDRHEVYGRQTPPTARAAATRMDDGLTTRQAVYDDVGEAADNGPQRGCERHGEGRHGCCSAGGSGWAVGLANCDEGGTYAPRFSSSRCYPAPAMKRLTALSVIAVLAAMFAFSHLSGQSRETK